MPVNVASRRMINIDDGAKVLIVDPRAPAGEFGWERPGTYRRSGSLVVEVSSGAAHLEAALQRGFRGGFICDFHRQGCNGGINDIRG